VNTWEGAAAPDPDAFAAGKGPEAGNRQAHDGGGFSRGDPLAMVAAVFL